LKVCPPSLLMNKKAKLATMAMPAILSFNLNR
jgi:hypothetical protein